MDNSSDLVECRNCGRHFNQQAIGRHEPICVKTGQKKRKVFDSSKQRAEGTELKQFIKKGPQSKSLGQTSGLRGNDAPVGIRRAGAQPSKSNWRLKHEELIQSLRAAKQAQHAIATGQPLPPPPPPSLNPDYVGCPYCNRRFNEKAAQRHISFCKEQHERLPTKKTIDNTTATRANARTNYKAPKPRGGKTATSAQMYDDDDMYNTRGGYSAGVSSTRGGYRESEPGQGRVLRTGRTPETYSEARELSAQQRATMSVKKAPVKQPLRPPQNDNGYYSNSDDSSSYTATSGGRGGGYGGGGYGSSTGGYGGYGGNNIGGGSGGSGGGYGSGSSMYGARNGSGRGMNARGGIGGSGSSAIGRGYDSIGSRNAAPVHSSSSTGKFCGNCGAGYPTVQAKFCSECGSRRS